MLLLVAPLPLGAVKPLAAAALRGLELQRAVAQRHGAESRPGAARLHGQTMQAADIAMVGFRILTLQTSGWGQTLRLMPVTQCRTKRKYRGQLRYGMCLPLRLAASRLKGGHSALD